MVRPQGDRNFGENDHDGRVSEPNPFSVFAAVELLKINGEEANRKRWQRTTATDLVRTELG